MKPISAYLYICWGTFLLLYTCGVTLIHKHTPSHSLSLHPCPDMVFCLTSFLDIIVGIATFPIYINKGLCSLPSSPTGSRGTYFQVWVAGRSFSFSFGFLCVWLLCETLRLYYLIYRCDAFVIRTCCKRRSSSQITHITVGDRWKKLTVYQLSTWT